MSSAISKTITLFFCLCLAACAEKSGEQRAEFFVFGTLLEVTIWGVDESEARHAFSRLQTQFEEMHREWHAWEPGLLTEVNQAFASGLPAQASRSIVEMTRRSQRLEEQTGGFG